MVEKYTNGSRVSVCGELVTPTSVTSPAMRANRSLVLPASSSFQRSRVTRSVVSCELSSFLAVVASSQAR